MAERPDRPCDPRCNRRLMAKAMGALAGNLAECDCSRSKPPLTVRFWDFIHGSYVRIAIREGQRLVWGRRWGHDEGWSSECRTWTRGDGVLGLEVDTDGRDCDGRLSTHAEFSCLIEDANEGVDGNGKDMPKWDNRKASQRDYTAEAAGY